LSKKVELVRRILVSKIKNTFSAFINRYLIHLVLLLLEVSKRNWQNDSKLIVISRSFLILKIQCFSSLKLHFAFICFRFKLCTVSSMNLYFCISQWLIQLLGLFSFNFCILFYLILLKIQLLLLIVWTLIVFSNVFHEFFGHYLEISQHSLEDFLFSYQE
jgi:hypothetical protein